jgi:ubiquinone/menaquinone biosynthesis C-methylase UbiE
VQRLSGVEEFLDGPLDDASALAANLRDIARINWLTGGSRLSRLAITAFGAPSSILDVGTGAADIPISLLADARRHGRPLVVTATDSRPEVLAAARVVRPSIERIARLDVALADGRALPYPDGSFDVAHSSMVIHHLEPDEAIVFLRELRRVARNGIVVNDLVRGELAWVGAWLVTHTVAASRFTRHDGPLSVRRAYDRTELAELIAAAGLATVRTIVGLAGHRVAIATR